MATMPTDQSQDPSQDDSGESESIVITITCASDGTFTVALGQDADASPDDQSDQPQTASSIDDACKMAKEMYQAESGEEDAEPAEGEDDNATMSPGDAKSAWSQMAKKKSQGAM